MHIAVVGTGYVGLVTGACFAEMGSHVTCVDIDEKKVTALKTGEIPIYEPGLENIVKNAVAQNLLHFTTRLEEAMSQASILFIAVGTPPGEDGGADLTHVLAVAKKVGQYLSHYTVIVDKSTVPVGTAEKVSAAIAGELALRGVQIPFDVVSNPEFLKEGAAIDDFMRPDRIVVGTESEKAKEMMTELYAPFCRTRDKLQFMGIRDAEMTKYAANAMLATKISFMNEVANLCERMGVDVENVRKGIGSDSRIGYAFIYPGCGYGGSCFPKDVKAIIHMAQKADFEPLLLNAVEERNQKQKQRLYEKVLHHFGQDLSKHTFAVWGLAFKPGTDDMREASSIVLIESLIARGAKVVAYDPVAKETAIKSFSKEVLDSGRLSFAEHQYQAIPNASALILVTEWKMFRQPDFEFLKHELAAPVIFDGRNQYDPHRLRENGFTYYGIGR